MIATIAAFALAADAAPDLKQVRTQSWHGTRFGTHAAFPGGLFRLQRESDNGDGATFVSADGAVLLIYGMSDPDPLPPRDYLAAAANREEGRVTYRHAGRDFAVVSGRRGDRTFYHRYQFDGFGGAIHAYRLEYPTRLQASYGPIIPRIRVGRW